MAQENKRITGKYSTFSVEMKVAVVLLVIVGIGGIVYGLRGIGFDLKKPFLAQLNYSGPEYLTLAERETREIEDQKSRDTDEDGLNDYDELNVYGTSPYLADTDSDGLFDGDELKSGKNPSCPEGKKCFGGSFSPDAVGSGVAVSIAAPVTPDLGLDLDTIGSSGDVGGELSGKSASELRAILASSGLSQEIIDGMSDTQIMQLFEAAFEEIEKSGVLDPLIDQLPVDSALETESAAN